MSRLPLRAKLTLAYSGVIALMLIAIGTFLYFHFKSGLDAGLDDALDGRAADIASVARERGPAGLRSSRPIVESGEGFAQIVTADGRVLQASRRIGRRPLLAPDELRRARAHRLVIDRGERARLLAQPVARRGLVVVVGASLREREEALETLNGALLIGGPLALLLATAAGYGLAAVALRPVEAMRQRAATISARDATARLPLPQAHDEIHRLGTTLNEMLARLQRALEHERAFVSDASHELRTPLAIAKAEIEVALRRESTTGELRESLRIAGEEVDRLAQLAADLLVMAAGEAGEIGKAGRPTDLGRLLSDVAVRFAARGRQAGREIVVRDSHRLSVDGDPSRLEQAFSNLVENALRHGSGTVTLSAAPAGRAIEVHVTDEGPGFPADFLPRAFERFSRPDSGRGAGGAGLGLAIVDVIARAHGGIARAANRPDGGADVWLSLPAAPG